MNSRELKKKIQQLLSSKLEKLSSNEIQKLHKIIDSTLISLNSVDYDQKLEELFQVPLEKRGYYQYYWDKSKIKKPTKTSDNSVKEKYYQEMKKYNQMISQKYHAHLKVLDKLFQYSEEDCLEIIESLSLEEKKLMSLLASLTSKSSKGASNLSLSNQKTNNILWIRELKNIKSLGVISNLQESKQ